MSLYYNTVLISLTVVCPAPCVVLTPPHCSAIHLMLPELLLVCLCTLVLDGPCARLNNSLIVRVGCSPGRGGERLTRVRLVRLEIGLLTPWFLLVGRAASVFVAIDCTRVVAVRKAGVVAAHWREREGGRGREGRGEEGRRGEDGGGGGEGERKREGRGVCT